MARLPERVAASASMARSNESALHAPEIVLAAARGMTPVAASARANAASKSSICCRNAASSQTVRIVALENIGDSRGERAVLMSRVLAPLPAHLSDARHRARSRFSCLGRKADASIWRAKSFVSTSLHDLEEKAFLKCVGVGLKELPLIVSIVKDAIFLHRSQQASIELVPAIDVVVIVVRNLEKRCPCRTNG